MKGVNVLPLWDWYDNYNKTITKVKNLPQKESIQNDGTCVRMISVWVIFFCFIFSVSYNVNIIFKAPLIEITMLSAL